MSSRGESDAARARKSFDEEAGIRFARHHYIDPTDRGSAASDIRSSRTSRSLRALLLTALTAAALSIVAPVAACPLTNPSCTVEKVEETVEETAGDVDETVDRTVEDVNETTRDVQETVDEVEETVDQTLNPGPTGPTTPPPPTEPEEPGPRDPGPGDDPKRDPRVKGDDVRRGVDRNEERGVTRGRPLTDPTTNLPPGGPASVATEGPDRERDESVGESAIEAAKDFAFPLIMSVLVGIFLVIQHRVDQRDPKFVLAPLEHELLSFE